MLEYEYNDNAENPESARTISQEINNQSSEQTTPKSPKDSSAFIFEDDEEEDVKEFKSDVEIELDKSHNNYVFSNGQVVLVRFTGYPTWPARITSESDVTEEVIKAKIPDGVLVFFFGTHDYAWMKSDTILPYDQKKLPKVSRSSKIYKSWMLALQETSEQLLQQSDTLAVSTPPALQIEASSTTSAQPRRKGRPPKPKAPLVSSSTPSVMKRSRGRPRKHPPKMILDEPEADLAQALDEIVAETSLSTRMDLEDDEPERETEEEVPEKTEFEDKSKAALYAVTEEKRRLLDKKFMLKKKRMQREFEDLKAQMGETLPPPLPVPKLTPEPEPSRERERERDPFLPKKSLAARGVFPHTQTHGQAHTPHAGPLSSPSLATSLSRTDVPVASASGLSFDPKKRVIDEPNTWDPKRRKTFATYGNVNNADNKAQVNFKKFPRNTTPPSSPDVTMSKKKNLSNTASGAQHSYTKSSSPFASPPPILSPPMSPSSDNSLESPAKTADRYKETERDLNARRTEATQPASSSGDSGLESRIERMRNMRILPFLPTTQRERDEPTINHPNKPGPPGPGPNTMSSAPPKKYPPWLLNSQSQNPQQLQLQQKQQQPVASGFDALNGKLISQDSKAIHSNPSSSGGNKAYLPDSPYSPGSPYSPTNTPAPPTPGPPLFKSSGTTSAPALAVSGPSVSSAGFHPPVPALPLAPVGASAPVASAPVLAVAAIGDVEMEIENSYQPPPPPQTLSQTHSHGSHNLHQSGPSHSVQPHQLPSSSYGPPMYDPRAINYRPPSSGYYASHLRAPAHINPPVVYPQGRMPVRPYVYPPYMRGNMYGYPPQVQPYYAHPYPQMPSSTYPQPPAP